MSRILHDGSWYRPISSRSISEDDYEHSILAYADKLFPNYLCVKFKASVQSEFGTSQADLALVDVQYRGWVVVEAELEHHSLSHHVEPQMRRLSSGRYDDSHARALCANSIDLDLERVEQMILSCDPEFLFVVPIELSEWRTTLSNMGVKLAAVQVFVDDRNRRLLAYDGDSPTQRPDEFVSNLVPSAITANAFEVELPAALTDENVVTILIDGQLTTWRFIRTQRAAYILPNGSLAMDRRTYVLERDQSGQFILKGRSK